MAEKEKKPFYKKWWVWVIAVIIIFAVVGGGEDETDEVASDEDEKTTEETTDESTENNDENSSGTENNNDSNNDSDQNETNENEEANVESEETEESTDSEEETEENENNEIEAGTYKIGDDLPAGEYLVFSDSMAYIESASDSTGDLDSILFNLNLANNAHAYVTVNEGEYFKIERGHALPVEEAPSVKPEDGVYTDGMYKVGEDIPAGEYQILLNENAAAGMGYYEVATSSSHQLGDIVTNENVQADTYLTVSDGQYLRLQDVTIETE